MTMRLIMIFLAALVVATPAQAHRFAPSLLKVTEVADDRYNFVWKTPTNRNDVQEGL